MATQLNSYIIKGGDTIHQIALREMGNADQWWSLVRLNNLAYPYIDGSGAATGARVKGLGESLLIPGNANDPAISRASVTEGIDTEGQYEILLGRDLALDGFGDLGVSLSSGDWATMAGIANLVQSLERRFRTRKGELAYHPEYGSDVWRYIGQTRDAVHIAGLRHSVRTTMLDEPRIKSVASLVIKEDFDHLDIQVNAFIIGVNDSVPLNLVIQ